LPDFTERLRSGMDVAVFTAILNSGHWTGTRDDLFGLLEPHMLGRPGQLPIREALDWIHSLIETTIKVVKFSHLPTTCGGSADLAVITTDGSFRWIRHRGLASALGAGVDFDG
jgi:hypothetical protein